MDAADPGQRGAVSTSEPHLRFPIRIGRKSRPLLLLWGVRGDETAYADLNDSVAARFGFFRMSTPLSNVARWRIEGPWLWLTAIGVRLGLRYRELSFCGSHRGGVRLDFREQVRWGLLRVPALYVGVEDLEGFAAALGAKGIPGEDARRSES